MSNFDKARQFINDIGITDDKTKRNSNLILVDDISEVVNAYVADKENNINVDDEDVYAFFDRHNIKWE